MSTILNSSIFVNFFRTDGTRHDNKNKKKKKKTEKSKIC